MSRTVAKWVLGSVSFVVAVGSTLGASCRDQECDECPIGAESYVCYSTPGQGDVVGCQGSQAYADAWCYNLGGQAAAPLNCDYADDESGGLETGETTWGADEWHPDDHVAYNSRTGAYEVDADFVAALQADGFAPLALDSARLEAMSTGYYVLVDVGSTDLAAVMGLRSRDVLLNVNGHELNNADNQLAAYLDLKDEAKFVLAISRAGATQRLTYMIVD